MAITDIDLSGKLFQDDGDPVNGATVALLETGTTSQETSTTTDSNGAWSFTETSLDTTYDIKITSGTSVRYILWSDEITTKGVDTASLKVRGVEGAAAPIYFFADQADDAGDGWRMQASASDTLAIGSDKASAGTIIDYLTITNGANAAASTVTVGGILTVTTTLDVNGTADFDVTDFDIASSGDIDLLSTYDAAAAIYLRENAGTSGTIKIHADQGTSVTEGAESINILSDAGGVGIRSTANLAKAVNITSDGGTTGSIAIFNDQGTSVTEGAESISLLSDAGGIGIRSTANLANAVNLTVDGGTSSTMTLFNDQGTAATEGASSIQLLSDVGGINIKSGLNGANALLLTADGGTSETIVLHADQGTGTGSIELLSDAGGIELDAGTDIILDAGGADIFLKDDGTLFGTLNNNSGELLIKSSSSGTTAATFSGANVTFAGTVDATTDFTVGSTVITDDSIVMTPSSSDTVTMTAATNGAFSLVTVDAAGTDANIQITADGTFEVDGTGITLDASSDIVFDSGGADFHFNVDATTICTMTKNGNSDFVIATAVQDKDLIINGNDGGSTITALTLDMSAAGAATFNDKVIATELDISGNMDIDGTSNLDAVDIDGNMQIDGSILVGVDDQGYDLKLYGDTASRYWHWDTSADGVVQRGTLTVGVNDTGHDVQFFGATSGKYLLWDESEDALAVVGSIVAGAATAEAGVALSAVGSAAQIKADSGGADHVYLYAGDNSSNSPAIVWTSGNLRFWGGADCFQIATDGGLFAPNLLAASASTDVNINGSNELHSVTSSEYYKYDKRSLDIDTNLIYQLQPRSYRFGEKKSDAPESWPKSEGETDDFGLTAEEVHRVLPELVNMREGKPYSVRYSMLSVLLLNEVKKLRDQVLV